MLALQCSAETQCFGTESVHRLGSVGVGGTAITTLHLSSQLAAVRHPTKTREAQNLTYFRKLICLANSVIGSNIHSYKQMFYYFTQFQFGANSDSNPRA